MNRSTIFRSQHVSVREAAMLLNAHPNSIRRWVKSGQLPAVKAGSTLWIPKVAVARHYQALLSNPATRDDTIRQLQAIADEAGVKLDPEALAVDTTAISGPDERTERRA